MAINEVCAITNANEGRKDIKDTICGEFRLRVHKTPARTVFLNQSCFQNNEFRSLTVAKVVGLVHV